MRRETFKNVLLGNVRTRTPEHRNCATENQRRKKTNKGKKKQQRNISKRHKISSGYTCTAGGCGPQCRWDGSSLQEEFIHLSIYLFISHTAVQLVVFRIFRFQTRRCGRSDWMYRTFQRSKITAALFFLPTREFCVLTINRLF